VTSRGWGYSLVRLNHKKALMAELARVLHANNMVLGLSLVHAFLFYYINILIIIIIITAISVFEVNYRVSADIPWISTESIGFMDIYRRAYGILWIPIGEFGRNLCHFWVSGHPVDSTGFLWILEPGGGTVKYSKQCGIDCSMYYSIFCTFVLSSSENKPA